MTDPLAKIKAHAEAEFQRTAHGEEGERVSIHEIMWLIGKVERLRGLLARLEWASARRWVQGPGFCPACHNYRTDGHTPGCELAAALRHREEGT